MHVAFIQIQLIVPHIGGEIKIDQAITIKIAGSDTSSIIEIFIHENIRVQAFCEGILKIHTGLFRRQQFEQRLR